MGNVVGGKVYTSSSEFTQMRVALKKRTSPSLDLGRFLSESLVCPWQSHQKRVSPLMPLPLSAAVWLLALSSPFTLQCLCICMIASVQTAKWKLWRKSTKLRPNLVSSLLNDLYWWIPCVCSAVGTCSWLDMRDLCAPPSFRITACFFVFCFLQAQRWFKFLLLLTCPWLCLGAGGLTLCRWFVWLENEFDLWFSVFSGFSE